MSLRSPLGRVLGLGSAKDGTGHWWAQRLTAIALVFLGPWFLVSVLLLDDLRFEEVTAWLDRPLNSILMLLTYATLAFHSKLGVQVVIEDYVHAPAIKIFSLLLNSFAHVVLTAAGLYAVLRVGLGTP